MGILLGLVLAIICATVLVLPFLTARRNPMARELDDLSETTRQREAIYDEIRMLQLERDVGRVDQPDYEKGLHRLRQQAAAILRREEQLVRSRGDRDWALEEEVRSMRQQLTVPSVGQVTCPNCSAVVETPASECPQCGTPLAEEDAR
jgi:hypothetical protein